MHCKIVDGLVCACEDHNNDDDNEDDDSEYDYDDRMIRRVRGLVCAFIALPG